MRQPHPGMDIQELRGMLDHAFDVNGWWPAGSEFEVMVGAILTQQTTWEKVDETLQELRRRGLLSPMGLVGADITLIEDILRPCGFYRQKASRIKNMAGFIVDAFSGDPRILLEKETSIARKQLLSLKGIGKETADSILLFAGKRAVFPAAAYVARVLTRTGVLDSSDYDEIQDFIHASLPESAESHARLYAQIVELAKRHCLSRPRCPGCPVQTRCAHPSADEKEEEIADQG